MCGEITTQVKSWRTSLNLGRSTTMGGTGWARTVWVCTSCGPRRTTPSNTTSPGARKAAPHRGEAAHVRMSSFHPCYLSGPVRGLCPSSRLRTLNPNLGLQFTPVQRSDSFRDVWFKGGMSSQIRLNWTGDGKWTLSDDIWNTSAATNAPMDSYALGKNEWLVTGDDENCYDGEPYTTFLKFTGCRETEFTCDDGQCV